MEFPRQYVLQGSLSSAVISRFDTTTKPSPRFPHGEAVTVVYGLVSGVFEQKTLPLRTLPLIHGGFSQN